MNDLTEEEVNHLLLVMIIRRRRRRRKNRNIWVKPFHLERLTFGQYYVNMPKLRSDDKEFFSYFRMSQNSFDSLLALLQVHIEKQDTHIRLSIPAEERLAITLR